MSTEPAADTFRADMDEALSAEITSRHSYFQLKYFVIGKEPTHQARMWQCLRELKARQESLTALDLQIEETRDQLELLEIDHQETDCVLPPWGEGNVNNVRRAAVRERQLTRKMTSTKDSLARLGEQKTYLLQEARFFLESYKNLRAVEPLKNFDDLASQKEYWGEKLAQKINLKMLLQNPLDMELIETVLALPDDIPVKTQMVGRLNAIQNQLLQIKEEYRKKLGA